MFFACLRVAFAAVSVNFVAWSLKLVCLFGKVFAHLLPRFGCEQQRCACAD
jgi:hypothetical protein